MKLVGSFCVTTSLCFVIKPLMISTNTNSTLSFGTVILLNAFCCRYLEKKKIRCWNKTFKVALFTLTWARALIVAQQWAVFKGKKSRDNIKACTNTRLTFYTTIFTKAVCVINYITPEFNQISVSACTSPVCLP